MRELLQFRDCFPPQPNLTHERDPVNLLKKHCLALSVIVVCSLPAFASVTVNSPSNGATVAPQFTLSASSTICSGQSISAMGFSLDSSSNTTIVNGTSINATVSATTGAHTLHVKAWGNAGAACVTDVALTVSAIVNGVSVVTPANGSTLSSPFTLTADALYCASLPVSAMGYSIDYGATTIVNSTAINASVSASSGAHTLHVKAWNTSGAPCVSDVPLTIASPAAATSTSTSSSGIAVSTPANNATLTSPFSLSANATSCSSQTVTAMGYSLDNSASTAIVQGTSVAASVTATAGAHTLHIKSWGNGGAGCVQNIAINVTAPAAPAPVSNLAISSPANGTTVGTPFTLAASATLCLSQAVSSLSYTMDGGSATNVSSSTLNTQIGAATGQHTIVVTAAGASGASCSSTVTVSVPDPSTTIPSYATSVSGVQALANWVAQYDPGNGGSASGWLAQVNSPSLSGNALSFNTSFSNSGGELYHVTFGDDTSAYNFFYDGWVYLNSSSSNIANIEMDMNQVMANGQTVIYGFQCDGYAGTWDYTTNAGTPTSPIDHWLHSNQPCNPRSWATNTWHHVQITYSRDDSGNVTYRTVWLDGVEYPINATVPSAFALGWGPVLLTNFQVDGLGSGSNTVYLDNLTISRW